MTNAVSPNSAPYPADGVVEHSAWVPSQSPSPSAQGPEQHFRLLPQEHGKQSAQEAAVLPSFPTRFSRYFNNLDGGVRASWDMERKSR